MSLDGVARADSWYDYHWANTATPQPITVVSSVGRGWGRYVSTAVSAWSASGSVSLTVVDGARDSSSRTLCDPIDGAVHVCSARYGNNAWLGWTDVWIAPDGSITKARVRINESYLGSGKKGNRVAKRHTVCHEIGHSLGLAHQTGASCMNRDFVRDAAASGPNASDYASLAQTYGPR